MTHTTARRARPERIRLRLRDDPSGSIPLPLPDRRMWPAGLVVGAMFAIFLAIEITAVSG